MSAGDPVLAPEVITRTTICDMPRDATFEQMRTSILALEGAAYLAGAWISTREQ